jgi:hypothetical protein
MNAPIYALSRAPDHGAPNAPTEQAERASENWIRSRTFEIQRDLAGIHATAYVTVWNEWADSSKDVVPIAEDFIGWLEVTYPDLRDLDLVALIFKRDQMPAIYREYADARALREAESINFNDTTD